MEALLSEDDEAGKTSGDPNKGKSVDGLEKQPRDLSKVKFKGVPKRAPVDTCPKGEEAKKDAKGKIILDKDGKVTCVSKKPWEKKKPPRTGPAKTDESVSRKNDTLLTEQKNMNTKLSLLEGKLDKYTTVITELKNRLEESGLDNAKLLYQNRVLDSVSLNERQKDKIVEAIKGAKSVEEAKIIFETLQSTVGTSSNTSIKVPDSLNEVVYRGSSAFMPPREEKQKVSDPFVARMKALAGLKKD